MEEVDRELTLQDVTVTPTVENGSMGRHIQSMAIHTTPVSPSSGPVPCPTTSVISRIIRPPSSVSERRVLIHASTTRELQFAGDDCLQTSSDPAETVPINTTDGVQASAPSGLDKRDEPGKTYVIDLGLGGLLEYNESDDCPPPPLNGMVSSPARLLEIWDDRFSTGKCKSPLVIRGVPVAVKYWQAFYGNFKNKRWNGIKQMWLSYQVRLHLFVQRP